MPIAIKCRSTIPFTTSSTAASPALLDVITALITRPAWLHSIGLSGMVFFCSFLLSVVRFCDSFFYLFNLGAERFQQYFTVDIVDVGNDKKMMIEVKSAGKASFL